MRKELLSKQTPKRWTKSEGSKTPRPDDPNLKVRKTLKIGGTPNTAPITRARSRETVINSPWIKSDVPTFCEEIKMEKGCGSSMMQFYHKCCSGFEERTRRFETQLNENDTDI